MKELQSGIIGATLKTILAIKTVVFVGYSFGDEDFIQIINYLRNEMGEIYPHIYIVTLDKTLKERLNYENSTSIVTSGTFFLHQLKLALIDKKIIKNNNIYWLIDALYDEINKLHEKVSGIDLTKYPGAIYTLSYQDGIIHSFERFLQNYITGEYNQPGRMGKIAGKYEEWIKKANIAGDFWNEAYYEGYTNGLVLLEAIEDDNNIVNECPFLYLPNAKIALTTYTIFMDELTRVSRKNDKFLKYAKKIIEEKIGDGMVVHHPPY